jgi:putative peptide zinc metalloprotease protein
MARLTASAAANAARARRTLLLARLPLFDPQRLFTRVAPGLAPLFSRWFVVPALLVVGVLAGYVIYDWPQLVRAVGESRSAGWSVVWAVLIAWAIVFLHECAHGLTCWHFGGRVEEIGLLWRFPLLAPYCNVDDVVLLPRGQRVATAFAGVFVSLLALVPFAVLWVSTGPGALHNLAGTVLLFGVVTAAINLVPFLRLDGYYMLTHALNLVDLRGDTYRFYARLLRGGPGAVASYPRRDRLAYGLYGLASAAFAVTVVSLLVRLWYGPLRDWVGPTWAMVILVAEGVALALFVWYGVRRARRRREAGAAAAPDTPAPA